MTDRTGRRPSSTGRSPPVPPRHRPRPARRGTDLLLHYWLFYAFDDWHSLHDRLWQTHEGDWENVTVGPHARLAAFAAYSEHCSGTVIPWASVSQARRRPPRRLCRARLARELVHAASAREDTASANCLKSGLGAIAKAKLATIVRLAEDGGRRPHGHRPMRWGRPGLAGVTPMTDLVQMTPGRRPGCSFPGKWGEGQIVWLGKTRRSATTISRGSAPGTPKWFSPQVAAAWHPAAG